MRIQPVLFAALLAFACSGGEADDTTADDTNSDDTTADDTNADDTSATAHDLMFTGSGYNVHDGQAYEVAITRQNGSQVTTQSGTQSGDTISWTFTDALEDGETYNLDFYFDTDSSTDCTAFTDHMWRFSTGAATADVTLTENHTTNFSDVCASF